MPNNAQNLESSFDKNAQSVKPPQSAASLDKADSGGNAQNLTTPQAAGFCDDFGGFQGGGEGIYLSGNEQAPAAESPKSAQKPTPIAIAFLSVLYSGKLPKAPGTAGSALSVLLGLPILLYSAQTLFLLACLLGIIAVREIDKWEAYSGKHDEKWIVIDELVGVWLAMSILCYGNPSLWLTIDKSADIWLIISTLWHEGHFVHIMLAFVLFRVFDIWKPSIIGRIDRKLKGGLGVVLDDVLAGLVAGIAGILVLFAYDVAVGIISARAY